jgi:hypothetical protein
MTVWKIFFYILGILPWTFMVSLMTFYIKAGQILGHSPIYNYPDPSELHIYKEYSPYVNLTSEIWLYSLVGWFVFTIIYFIVRKRIELTPIIISGIGQLLGILFIFSGIFEWYVD